MSDGDGKGFKRCSGKCKYNSNSCKCKSPKLYAIKSIIEVCHVKINNFIHISYFK